MSKSEQRSLEFMSRVIDRAQNCESCYWWRSDSCGQAMWGYPHIGPRCWKYSREPGSDDWIGDDNVDNIDS